MKTTFVSKENNNAKFTLEFTAEEFESAQVKVYQKTKNKFEVSGFRKGKAPRSIIEKKYGEGIFFEDAIDELLGDCYPKAVAELGLDVVDSPKIELSDIAKGKGFEVTVTVACFPEIEVKDYKGVTVKKVEDKATDEEVTKELEALQKRNARVTTVERAAQNGDTVVLDYAGFVGETQFEGGTAENQNLTLGSGMFIPGFEEQLVGVAAGESKDVNVTFPTEYHAPDLAGKEAVFHCLVHEVKEEQLPELDDDFAQDVSEFDTLDELKADIKKKADEKAANEALSRMKDEAIGKVVEANPFDVPAAMIEDEIDSMINEVDQNLRYQGLSIEQYVQFMGTTLEGLRTQVKPDAEARVRGRVVLSAVAAAEKVEATEEEVEAEIAKMAENYGMKVEDVKSALGADAAKYVSKDIKIRKTVDFIFDNAVIE